MFLCSFCPASISSVTICGTSHSFCYFSNILLLFLLLLFSLRMLRNTRVATRKVLKVYLTIIRPILEYGVQACQDIPAFLSDKLELVQKRALLIMYPSLGYVDALSFAQLTSLATRRNQLCTKYFQTLHNSNHPDHCLVPNSRGHTYGHNLRTETICNTKACNNRNMYRTKRSDSFITFYRGHSV